MISGADARARPVPEDRARIATPGGAKLHDDRAAILDSAALEARPVPQLLSLSI